MYPIFGFHRSFMTVLAVAWLAIIPAPAQERVETARPATLVASGPWVGAVTASSAVVTARLHAAQVSARLVASTSPDLSSPVYSAQVVSSADSGNVVKLSLGGLSAGTRYHYGIEVGGVLEPDPTRQGRFKTFPAGASRLRIGMGACAQTDVARLSFDALLAASPDLFINMGDFHYYDTNSTNPDRYRKNYIAVFDNASQAALYRNVPTAYIWDDHDYCGNDSSRTSVGRQTVRQVYREWTPHYPLAEGPGGAIHQAFNIGRVRVIMTDLRSEADPLDVVDDSAKTKMGAAQKQWFKNQLLAARDTEAPLILWVSSAPWIGAPSTTTDTWQNHTTERREIADFIKAEGIQNLVLLSGDMHALAYDDGTHSDYATGGGAPLRVLHAAALGRNSATTKGGPYSGGAPIRNPDNGILGQYGLLDIADTGGNAPIAVTFTGWRAPETSPRLSYAFTTERVRPLPVTGLAVTPAPGRLKLSWHNSSSLETGCRVERSATGSAPWTTLETTPADATTYADTTAKAGHTYHYRVVAVNDSAHAAPSPTVSAAP